jgi:Tfp pilus assembly protein PilF
MTDVGKSAYEAAVQCKFKGTEEEWRQALHTRIDPNPNNEPTVADVAYLLSKKGVYDDADKVLLSRINTATETRRLKALGWSDRHIQLHLDNPIEVTHP